ncbi:unnamed protein product [marine sediment metagenome]|uniref:Uncharacterized protein n=1 Tax=marine sediment metagenome TaxID=412755 RepID=X1TQ88_9ZZZZ
MAKYKTLELHLHTMTTTKLGPNIYKHNLTLIDWDDGEEVKITMTLSYPITAVTPLKLRVVVEDIPEAPAPT